MSQLMLMRLVGLALLDREFCDGLMDGKRSALLEGFDLTEQEREVIASLESRSLREFAGSLCDWLNKPQAPPPHESPCHAIRAGQEMCG